jgi:tetratricopeptide (TPR) repeat protein
VSWFRRAHLAAGVLLALCVCSVPLHAEEEESTWKREEAKDPEIQKRPQPRVETQERYADALDYLFDERFEEAKQELDKFFLKRLNPAEQAMVHQGYAYLAGAEGDREEARRRFQLAIDSGGLFEQANEARYKIASLYIQDEEWSEASKALEEWFSQEPDPNAAAYYLLALTYYQQERYADALVPATRAIEITDEPKESWLQLVLGIHLLEKDYESAIPIVEGLIALYPSLGHFMNLSTVYGALGNYEEAAIPLQLAYEQGLLTEDDHLRRLGQLLLFLNLPYRAAEVLDQGLDEEVIDADSEVLAMLSNSWIAAREYEAAVDPLERAASLSDDGELYVRLAQVHVQRENWDGATGALRKALEKGHLDQTGDAHLLMGIALYSDKKTSEARRWFASASDFESSAKEARVWLGHIDQELAAAAAASDSEAASGG